MKQNPVKKLSRLHSSNPKTWGHGIKLKPDSFYPPMKWRIRHGKTIETIEITPSQLSEACALNLITFVVPKNE